MLEEKENEERINIMTLGNTEVGKTSFILRYSENQFQDTYLATIGIDFKLKTMTINEKPYKIFLYDTTGQERYKSLSVNMIKNAHGVIIMYDISNKTSFNSVGDWIKNVKDYKGEDFPMILIGNKIDKEKQRIISKEDGEKIGKKYNIDFIEISNKQNINVNEAGLTIVKKIIEKRGNEYNESNRDNSVTYSLSDIVKVSNKDNRNKKCCRDKD